MKDAITAQQMRDIERAAIDSGAVTGLELMERAGQGVIEAVMEEWPELATGGHRAVVLCGPGNNGGDGFVVARLLKETGWEVVVALFGESDVLPPDAKSKYETLPSAVQIVTTVQDILNPLPDLLIDAVFGIGMTRPPTGELRSFLKEIENCAMPTPEVAIDIPTGLHADTGEVLEVAWKTALTVTFHRAKLGHVLKDGPDVCGKVVVKDIGL